MTTLAYGSAGDVGKTTAGEYSLVVPGGVTSLTVKSWAAGGGGGSGTYPGGAGGDSGAKRSATWLVQAKGGTGGGSSAGAGGTGGTGATGYAGGAGSRPGSDGGAGGGGAGPTSVGGAASGNTGGTAGTGGYAGAGGNGTIFKGADGTNGTAAGGGGGGSSTGNGGGGGGEYRGDTISVTAGETITIVVGAAGAAGASATGFTGALGRVQVDYTADLNFADTGTITAVATFPDTQAGGIPPLLWQPWYMDTAAFDETATVAATVALTATDTFESTFPETGTIAGTVVLTGTDTLTVAHTGTFDSATTITAADGYGPGWSETGTIAGTVVLSSADTWGIATVHAETCTIAGAVVLSGADDIEVVIPGALVIHPQGMVPGTSISAYRRWEWLGPVAAKLNAGPGAAVATTTVADDLTATFVLAPGEYVAYAPAYPTKRLFFMVTE